MTALFSGQYDTKIGNLRQADTYKKLLAEIRQEAKDVLFFTKAPLKARAAAEAGITSILVLTHCRNVERLSPEDKRDFQHIRTFLEVEFEEGDEEKEENAEVGEDEGEQEGTEEEKKEVSS